MGSLGRMKENALKQEEKNVNDLAIYQINNDNCKWGVMIGEIFPGLVENIKLRKANATGDKKECRAFFNTFRGQPQVSFKYGQKFYVFNLTEATELEKEYNKRSNFK